MLVYVQALPVSFPSLPKKFSDLDTADFEMSHSSKAALAFATSLKFPEILALGFSPVLQEALARGATEVKSVPLCDDPLQQASFFPEGDFSHIIVGENPDWIFSGALLCGVLVESKKIPLDVLSDNRSVGKNDHGENSLLLVLDSGEFPSNLDIRRIKNSTSANINPENVIGESKFSTLDDKRSEKITGNASEIASILARKLRRLVPSSL